MTVRNTRLRFCSQSQETPEISGKPLVKRAHQVNRPKRAFDGEKEAQLVALVCSAPPDGANRWTLELVKDRLIQMQVVENVGKETIRRTLKKNELKPWHKKCWCIPPTQNARFVAAMEDVLTVYQRPYEPAYPVVCLDEAAKQILGEVREPLPMTSGQVERADNQYERRGTAALFMAFEPLAGKRSVWVRKRRTCVDFAQVVRDLVEAKYAQAAKVVLVLDNLNTHGAHSLYEAFAPDVAQRINARIEWHFTPRHGSWLNMAEIELSVLARQCLKERMESQERLEEEVKAWQIRRNAAQVKVDWQFTTSDARIKLKRLYPQILTS